MLAEIEVWEQTELSVSHSDVQKLSLKIKVSAERMEKLVSAYLDGDIPKDIYLNQKDVIMRSTLTLKDKMKAFEQRRNTWVEPLREWVLDLQQATFLHESDNLSEIASFVQKIGTNHTVRDKTAHFATPSPFQFIATRQAVLASSVSRTATPRSLSEDEVLVCAPSRYRNFHRQPP
jgi:alpha-N-acetylglucosamine transferase